MKSIELVLSVLLVTFVGYHSYAGETLQSKPFVTALRTHWESSADIGIVNLYGNYKYGVVNAADATLRGFQGLPGLENDIAWGYTGDDNDRGEVIIRSMLPSMVVDRSGLTPIVDRALYQNYDCVSDRGECYVMGEYFFKSGNPYNTTFGYIVDAVQRKINAEVANTSDSIKKTLNAIGPQVLRSNKNPDLQMVTVTLGNVPFFRRGNAANYKIQSVRTSVAQQTLPAVGANVVRTRGNVILSYSSVDNVGKIYNYTTISLDITDDPALVGSRMLEFISKNSDKLYYTIDFITASITDSYSGYVSNGYQYRYRSVRGVLHGIDISPASGN